LEGKGRRLARKILLADDSVTAQNMGRKILADAGYDVVTVNNGSAALKRINEINPDLIVLDVYMPGYSGLEVCQRLKESADTAHIPVLLTVGKLEPFKPEEARRVRADSYIVKPFEASELLTAITKLEDRMVPHAAEGSRFGATVGGVERFNGEASSRKSARVPETDTGWKNRIRFPSKKKKEEEPDPEDVAAAAGATFQDSKKGKKVAGNGFYGKAAEKEPAVVPDIPRDITPEELDALSALAEKLDAPQSSGEQAKVEKPAIEEPVATAEQSQPSVTTLEVIAPQSESAAGAEVTPQETESPQDSPMVAMAVDSVAAQVEAVAFAVTVEDNHQAVAETEQQGTIQAEATVTETSTVPETESLPSTPVTVDLAAPSDAPDKVEDTPSPLMEPEPSSPNAIQPVEVLNAGSAAEAEVSNAEQPAVVVPVENVTSEAPAEIIATANVATPQADDPAPPSDAELAAALQLLTPATGASDLSPSNGTGVTGHPSQHLDEGAPSGPRWVAESVALSAEESSIALEAEMFGTSFVAAAGSAAASATSANPVAAEGGMERGIGFSGIAAAVENRLAEAGLGAGGSTWASERERSVENAAAEAASALEASLELLAAASAANPLPTRASQAVDDVERRLASARSETDRRESRDDAAEEKFSQENSATFADAMTSNGDKNEIESTANRSGESHEAVQGAVIPTIESVDDSMELEGQDSMSKNGKTKSGKSNSNEIRTEPQPSAEGDLVEAANQKSPALDDPQKAMAAAASEGSSAGTDASTIASIVDSVMADLRPRIVEEIARKLAKK
jgi:CheY-like chemotaxis protein